MSQSTLSIRAMGSLRRNYRGLLVGICKVRAGESFRTGARAAQIPLNSFISKFYCPNKGHEYKNTALTWLEELEIVRMILKEHHPNGYVPDEAIKDATARFVLTLPADRRERIRFTDGRPSKSFCRGFQQRHKYAIYSTKPFNGEGDEAPFITAKEMVKHFVDLTGMIEKDKLHPDCIWSLTCRTIPVEIGTASGFKRYLSIIIMCNASGQFAWYKHFVHNERLTDVIQQSDVFQDWLERITRNMGMVGGERKETRYSYHLLLCDYSLDFMNSSVREYLFTRNVILYSIPGLGDGFPGNHDVGGAGALCDKFEEFAQLELEMKLPPRSRWTEGTLLMLIHLAQKAALTPRSISDSFAEAGIFPLDEVRFYKHPRPLSWDEHDTICDMEKMCELVDDAKRNSISI